MYEPKRPKMIPAEPPKPSSQENKPTDPKQSLVDRCLFHLGAILGGLFVTQIGDAPLH